MSIITPRNVWIVWKDVYETVNKSDAVYFRNSKLGPSSAKSLAGLYSEKHLRTWHWCLVNFSSNRWEEPLDKVYGFMGLIDRDERCKVDHSKSKFGAFEFVVKKLDLEYGWRSDAVRILGRNMGIEAHDIAKFVEPEKPMKSFLPVPVPIQDPGFLSDEAASTNARVDSLPQEPTPDGMSKQSPRPLVEDGISAGNYTGAIWTSTSRYWGPW